MVQPPDIHETCRANATKLLLHIEKLEVEIVSLQNILANHNKWCGYNPANRKEED